MATTIEPLDVELVNSFAQDAQATPRLSDEMAERIASYGSEELLPKGTLIFERGQRGVDFFLVRQGEIEIYDFDCDGQETVFMVHGANQFTGELNLFNDQEILVFGRTRVESRVVRIKRSDFRRLIIGEPEIGEIILRAFILRRIGLIRHSQGGVVLVGPGHGADTIRIQNFLTRNGYPHRLLDTEVDGDAAGFLRSIDVAREELPVLIAPGKQVWRNPSNSLLADGLGLTEHLNSEKVFDVVVVGAGPAGLASAVYAASEGLGTIVVEALAPGGQAGTSSRIENYLGFPTGISGWELAARAQTQAQKFGAHMVVSRPAVALECKEDSYRLRLEDDQYLCARVIVIATGARYRKLGLPNEERYEGISIYYAATSLESKLCAGDEVIVVGGGNSAGQAALYLSRTVAHVHLLIRSSGLAATMSDYLVQSIQSSSRITLHPNTVISGLEGDTTLERVQWTNRLTGQSEWQDIGNIFVMIGAEPNTEWLGGCLKLDSKGFIKTGQGADGKPLASPYATSLPGIYAVGDVRSGSVKRVASGVGEGSVVVQAIHKYLNPDVV